MPRPGRALDSATGMGQLGPYLDAAAPRRPFAWAAREVADEAIADDRAQASRPELNVHLTIRGRA